MLSDQLPAAFEKLENKIASYGVKIFSPDQHQIEIPFLSKNQLKSGYVSPRIAFDDLLFRHAKEKTNVDVVENCTVEHIEIIDQTAHISSTQGVFTCKLLIGADGAHSVVSKYLATIKVEKEHYCAGLRVYYENVAAFHQENYIELHFIKEILPGYLWVFPLADNKANVGIGMLSSEIAKKKINLKETLVQLINTHPELSERFKNAKALESIKGFGLPIGSKKREISGNHFLLCGDAAALIDPFSGEGIANAIRSGRVAAEHAIQCFEKKDFSVAFNKKYDEEIYRRMWKEFKISRTLQNLSRFPKIFNFIIKRTAKSRELQQILTEALADIEKKKKMFLRPSFYFRLFFR